MYHRDFTVFEFAYWLQGALEISATDMLLDSQIELIKRRLSDVPKFDEDLRFVLGDLTADQLAKTNLTYDEAVAFQKRKEQANTDTRYLIHIWFILTVEKSFEAFQTINDIQQSIFIHDIDPTYEGDQEYFHAVHRGEIDPEDTR